MRAHLFLGSAAILFAIGFNVPYAVLAVMFDYPGILREPAGHVLERFAAGGAPLVLTWYAFVLAALLFVPLAAGLARTRGRVAAMPGLAIGAAIAGGLSGALQAIGLARWVFVIPAQAAAHAAGDPSASVVFDTLNAYGGVAIGEHLGQIFLALFAGLLASVQWTEQRRAVAITGMISAAANTIGTGEGLALVLGGENEVFSLFTITGFFGFSAWLAATGAACLRRR
jgi:hypothetical protein